MKGFAVCGERHSMALRSSPNLSFRVPAAAYRELAARASMMDTTPGLYAKHVVVDHVSGHGTLEILARLQELEDLHAELRRNLSVALEALLLSLPGKPFTREQVAEFVTKNLNPRGPADLA
ncbi:MAG: hypothetical protein R3F56_04420 [Planctomycetota bacterium]